ncbi:MAG: bifunctional 4-hydroxy-2-oxoglutarate aldolase/2-dehydro-3-deoxy-phosphogluconate aldolase [Hyphomicrobiales bacterium]|nr:bifunctional 4-hydroxy-2-oxoglutarate aldolase/2-dehydro-3-deoxy-phosphogluconate aldolase [Hyphomicrobiales bacterium]MCY4049050.1 bifunctional 4-hydroxy-2-oxoglutarate aldolase/2-dehydro-3-deoxy-phosphogluconate aldolase [Hyphomicrobiales bacterium]MCY4053476.1 bifunctional 4-hydroxy-2-oxoglutarate aldolase/2-dehydro-3-deoxy-phosphogluconate aldolase [Hyphomicrobiales bacterium]
MTTTADIKQICRQAPMIPVLVIGEIEDAVPMARALIEGGLRVFEITLRSDCALGAIERIAKACPEALVGAGTLKAAHDVDDCINAGAVFGASPGSPAPLVEKVLDAGFPFLPGCVTPTEAMALFDCGFEVLKFFPAEASGGVKMLESMISPLPDVAFCPTGGISLENAKHYLKLPNVITVGGSWVAPSGLIAQKDWNAIRKTANRTCEELLCVQS